METPKTRRRLKSSLAKKMKVHSPVSSSTPKSEESVRRNDLQDSPLGIIFTQFSDPDKEIKWIYDSPSASTKLKEKLLENDSPTDFKLNSPLAITNKIKLRKKDFGCDIGDGGNIFESLATIRELLNQDQVKKTEVVSISESVPVTKDFARINKSIDFDFLDDDVADFIFSEDLTEHDFTEQNLEEKKVFLPESLGKCDGPEAISPTFKKPLCTRAEVIRVEAQIAEETLSDFDDGIFDDESFLKETQRLEEEIFKNENVGIKEHGSSSKAFKNTTSSPLIRLNPAKLQNKLGYFDCFVDEQRIESDHETCFQFLDDNNELFFEDAKEEDTGDMKTPQKSMPKKSFTSAKQLLRRRNPELVQKPPLSKQSFRGELDKENNATNTDLLDKNFNKKLLQTAPFTSIKNKTNSDDSCSFFESDSFDEIMSICDENLMQPVLPSKCFQLD